MRIRWGIAWDLGGWGPVVTKCEVCGVGSGDRLLDLEARGGLDVVAANMSLNMSPGQDSLGVQCLSAED